MQNLLTYLFYYTIAAVFTGLLAYASANPMVGFLLTVDLLTPLAKVLITAFCGVMFFRTAHQHAKADIAAKKEQQEYEQRERQLTEAEAA
jgi:hypothetical protein